MAEYVEYKAPEDRTPDSQYHDLLVRIMDKGDEVHPIQGEAAKSVVGAQLRYKFENGFPIITERDLSGQMMNSAISELVAFLNGARTQEELESWGCNWWSKWLTKEQCAIFSLEEGDMGDGSYGAAWTKFPTAEGESFNQIDHLVQQMRERPYLRTHVLTPWIPQYALQHEGLTRKVVVAPCHGYVHVLMRPETKEMSLHHFQRSGDIPVGVPFNMIQYGALGLMLAKTLDYKLKEIVYTFSDAHIYERQYDKVEQLLERDRRALGTVSLTTVHDRLQAYRADDFELTDYNPHPKMLIRTPV